MSLLFSPNLNRQNQVTPPTTAMPSDVSYSQKLFVADDNVEFADFVRKVAHGEGWRVTLSKNGQELIDKLSCSEGPAIVIVDLMMPEMDGIEVIKQLAKLDRCMRVRFITGGAMSNVDAAQKIASAFGLALGPTLLKPITMTELRVELLRELVHFEAMKLRPLVRR